MSTALRAFSFTARLLLLAGAGAGLGAIGSTLTSDAVRWQTPPLTLETASEVARIDQAEAGRSWARTAFDGGLRRCPEMNADFIAACQAEMKALAARPDFQPGTYGGPLLVTQVAWQPPEPPAPPPDPEPVAIEPAPAPEPVPPAFEPTPANYPAADDRT